jgi:hypothetical protein
MRKPVLTARAGGAVAAVLLAALVGAASPASAATCGSVSGNFNELVLPKDSAPNDPGGRVLGNVDGTLKGVTTATVTSREPRVNGNFFVVTSNVFLTDEGNMLFTRGEATWSEVSRSFYQVELTLQVTGGTGKYAGASGSIKIRGVGNNISAASGEFVHEYRGQVCTPD